MAGLERRVDWGNPTQAGVVFSSAQREPELSVHAALRRGWFFGSQAFRENLMAKLRAKLEEDGRKRANGYNGPEVNDHQSSMAEKLVLAGCEYFELTGEDLRNLTKSDERKALIASLVHRETTVPLEWISRRLEMGVRAGVCRSIKRYRERFGTSEETRAAEKAIMSRINS